ncbi:MAG: hypothetical protein R3F56_01145 [Planctomycetota bacterium]
MSLAWTWCVKEWRAQRAFLFGYATLMASAVTAVLTLAHWRGVNLESASTRAMTVLTYALTLAIGSVFAAASAVRGELVGTSDRLWCRLPGALRPAMIGKLLFVGLAALMLAASGLLVGQAWLAATHLGPASCATLLSELALLMPWLPLSLASLPWVFAVALWMPGARLAIGATVVLLGSVLVAVESWLRASPGLRETLAVDFSLPIATAWIFLLGFAVAWVSCVRGRRGGDSGRSARLGAALATGGAAPPAIWFGAALCAYWWPDVQHLHGFTPLGATADGRYAVVQGSDHARWPGFAVRIDLRTGEAARVVRANEYVGNLLSVRGQAHLLDVAAVIASGQLVATSGRRARVVDLATLRTTAFGEDLGEGAFGGPQDRLPDTLRNLPQRCSLLRQPDGLGAWLEGQTLCLENRDGTTTRERLDDLRVASAGHGLRRDTRDTRRRHYDFTLRRWVELPTAEGGNVAVRGLWLLRPSRRSEPSWRRFDPETSATASIPALTCDAWFLGLLDDDRALFGFNDKQGPRLVAYAPARDDLVDLPLPAHPFLQTPCSVQPTGSMSSYGRRDPSGRMLVTLQRRGRPGNLIVAIDPSTRACATVLAAELLTDILAFEPDGGLVCCEDYNRIVRYAPDGTRSVVYPRR